jgi:hypothetical protein
MPMSNMKQFKSIKNALIRFRKEKGREPNVKEFAKLVNGR